MLGLGTSKCSTYISSTTTISTISSLSTTFGVADPFFVHGKYLLDRAYDCRRELVSTNRLCFLQWNLYLTIASFPNSFLRDQNCSMAQICVFQIRHCATAGHVRGGVSVFVVVCVVGLCPPRRYFYTLWNLDPPIPTIYGTSAPHCASCGRNNLAIMGLCFESLWTGMFQGLANM